MIKVVHGLVILLVLYACNVFASVNSIVLPTTVTQDKQGFVWVGTQTKAIRYDGHTKLSFVSDVGYIQKIIPYRGRTYVAAKRGVYVIDQDLKQTLLYKTGIDNGVLDIAILGNDLFIAQENSLNVIRDFKNESTVSSLLSYPHTYAAILAATSDNVCLSVGKNIDCFQPNLKSSTSYLLQEDVTSMLANATDLYLSTSNGLYEIINKALAERASIINISSMAFSKSNIWLVQNNKLKLFNVNRKAFVEHNYSRNSSSDIYSVFESNDKTLFVLANNIETIYDNGLKINKLQGIAETSGMAWIVSLWDKYIVDIEGVFKLTENNTIAEPLANINKVTKGYWYTAYAENDDLWLGGYYGLFKANPYEDTVIDLSHLIDKSTVHCIKRINAEVLAICAIDKGVYWINTESLTAELHVTEKSIKNIIDVIYDKSMNAWLATEGGLLYYNNGAITRLLTNSHVIKLFKHNEMLYVATLDDGAFMLDTSASNYNPIPIDFSGIGERIHDIKVIRDDLVITTNLGLGILDLSSNKVTAYPLGYSVGRLASGSSVEALSAHGELLNPTTKIIEKEKLPLSLKLSEFSINGVNQPLADVLSKGAFVNVSFSTNDYLNVNNHQYRIKLNNAQWSAPSTINYLSFLPKHGENTLQIEAITSRQTLHKTIVFTVEKPWYMLIFVQVLIAILALASLTFSVVWLRKNKQRFIDIDESHKEMIEKINDENQKFSLYIQQKANAKLARLGKQIYSKSNEFTQKVIKRNTRDLSRNNESISLSLNKIMGLFHSEQYKLLDKELNQLIEQVQIDAHLSAPDILLDNNIADATQKMVVSKISERPFLFINFHKQPLNLDGLLTTLELQYAYKSMYEILTFIIEEKHGTEMFINLMIEDNTLVFRLNVESTEVTLKDFTQSNIGLFEARVLCQSINAKIKANYVDSVGSIVEIVLPIEEKEKQGIQLQK